MRSITIRRSMECETIKADWGALTWYASARLGNSTDLTVGKCVIRPGCANPKHSHPNCSETLVVMQGTIMHTVEEGREVELNPGDTITIPPTVPHRARNRSNVDAVLLIAFSSANRETKGE